MGEKRTIEIPLITRESETEFFACLQAQVPFKPSQLWLGNEKIELDSQQSRPLGIGEWLRVPLRGAKKDQPCAFYGIDHRNQAFPIIVGGTIQGKALPAGVIIYPDSPSFLAQINSSDCGVVVGLELEPKIVCGTCRGIGKVGFPNHEFICPNCQGKNNGVTETLTDRLFVDDFRIGLNSQMISPQFVPAIAYRGKKIRSDLIVPGQFISFMLTNRATYPILLSGKIIFEIDETPSRELQEESNRIN
jgi:hypothetical protein